MTSKQRMSILLHRWPAACRTQKWNPNDRPLRLRVISEAVGREISSMSELNNDTDIDRVYAHLGQLSDDLRRTAETIPGNDSGYRRRLLWLIRKHARTLGGEPYVVALARDRFHLAAGFSSLEDLSTDQLHQLMMTLNARAFKHARQNASLDSEESFPDTLEFVPETEAQLSNEPF